MGKIVKNFWTNEKEIIKYIFVLFVISRVLLTIVGVCSRTYLEKRLSYDSRLRYSESIYLDIWGIWDSGFYMDIAKRGYSQDQNFEFHVSLPSNEFSKYQINYVFFPLYPLLIKTLQILTGNFFISGIIVSNLSLLISSFLLFKLVSLSHPKETAKKSVKFLFLFPTSFIYSGVFAEATTVLFLLASAYFAKKDKLLKGAVFSSLSVLTKITGIFSIIFLILNNKFSFKDKKVILIFFIPVITLALFFYYQYTKSGDFLIFFHTESLGWGTKLTNPIQTILVILLAKTEVWQFFIIKTITILFIFFEIALISFSFKKIPLELALFWIIAFALPLTSGDAPALSIPRHSLLLFPQFLGLSFIAKRKSFDLFLSLFLASFQLILMFFWVNGFIV